MEPVNKESGNTDKKGKLNKKWLIVFGVCLAVLIAAIVFIVVYVSKQNRTEEVYESLAETARATTQETTTQETTTEEETTAVEIPIDFEALWEENDDIYAWIYIEDTPIDYPVLRSTTDVDYYLDHTVDYVSGLPGSIYTQSTYNGDDFTDNVTVIYGHNMKNDTMFGSLNEYQDSDYREEHSTIIIYTPEHILTYEIIFTVTYNNRLIPYYFDLDTDSGYTSFWNSINTEHYIPSWVSDEYEFSTQDRMIVLSTCNGNSSQRYLVGAVLVDEQ